MDKLKKIKKALPLRKNLPNNAGKRKPRGGKPPKGQEHLKITPSIEKFCKEYVINLCNGAEAVRRSFPNITTSNSAASKASQLLRSINVQDKIKEIKEGVEKATGISKTFMVQELLDIADGHIDIVETREEYNALPNNRKKAVKKVEWTSFRDAEGNERKALKIEYYSKLECFKLIADIMGYTQKGAPVIINQQNNLFSDTEKEFKDAIEI